MECAKGKSASRPSLHDWYVACQCRCDLAAVPACCTWPYVCGTTWLLRLPHAQGHGAWISDAAISRVGGQVVTVSGDSTGILWDATTGGVGGGGGMEGVVGPGRMHGSRGAGVYGGMRQQCVRCVPLMHMAPRYGCIC